MGSFAKQWGLQQYPVKLGDNYAPYLTGNLHFTLTGVPNHDNFIYNSLTNSGGTGDGFNAVANPFAAPIDWTYIAGQIISDPASNVWTSCYVWDALHGTYCTIAYDGTVTSNSGYGVASPYIQNGAGFEVYAFSNGASLTIPKAARTSNTGMLYRRAANPLLRLSLIGDSGEDQIVLEHLAEAESGKDRIDAIKRPNPAGKPNFSSEGFMPLAINALPENFTGSVELSTAVPANGNYTIEVKELQGVNVSLEDKKTSTITPLSDYTKVNVNLTTSDKNRFVLHYGQAGSQSKVQIYAANKEVTVVLPENENSVIEAVNTLGQVMETVKGTSALTRFSLAKDGIYIIRVKTDSGLLGNVKIAY